MSKAIKVNLRKEDIEKFLSYDKEHGKLYWKSKTSSASRIKIGNEAGYIRNYKKNSYKIIVINGIALFSHRIIWLLETGEWPKDQIDHRDGNGLNNKIENLKSCTNSENCKNQRKRSNNTTGTPNVYYHKGSQNFRVSLRFNGKLNHLGSFDTIEEAIDFRNKAWDNYCSLEYSERHGK
jgi:hypothetical protein